MAPNLHPLTTDQLKAHTEHLAVGFYVFATHKERDLVVKLKASWVVDHSAAYCTGWFSLPHCQASSLEPSTSDAPVCDYWNLHDLTCRHLEW
jgi:hypothetical protein